MKLNARIEHTLLNPKANWRDLRKLCNEAKEYAFRSVCVNPEWVAYCKKQLVKTNIKVVQTYKFPTSRSTLLEGDEIDVYLALRNIAKTDKTKMLGKKIIEETLNNLKTKGIDRKRVKVVIETHVLSIEDIIYVSKELAQFKIGFIKSSTGVFRRINHRCNFDDLALIQKGLVSCDYKPKIKIAGNVRTNKEATELINRGADLVGCSKSIAVVTHVE